MKRLTRLSRPDLRQAAAIDGRATIAAQEWWYDNAPPSLAAAYDPLVIPFGAEMPTSAEELNDLLAEMYPGPNGAARRRHYQKMWLAGALFFLVGGELYNRLRNRVPGLTIRGAIDVAISSSRQAMMQDCTALREGQISLAEWEVRMGEWVRTVIIAGAVLAAGGSLSITAVHWAIVERNLEAQMGFLHDFAGRIASGEQPLNGSVCRIMGMYLQSGRGTYHDVEASIFNDRGFDEYASVTTARESCRGCVEEERRGFVPIGELVPIGSRDCLTHCLCYYIYRKSTTGEVDARS